MIYSALKFIFLPDKACYDARTSGEIGWVKTDPPPPVAKSHCDLLSYITFKDDGLMKPFCEGDCSCCRPKQTEGNKLSLHYRHYIMISFGNSSSEVY